MDLIRRAIPAILLACSAVSPAKAADPFITVHPTADGSTGLAWWLLDMNSQPAGDRVAGVTLAQINAALPAGEARWCAAQVLTPASFTSPDAAVRREIAQYVRGNIFGATTRMTGAPLMALVGNYSPCEGGVAPFVLLVRQGAAGATVAHVHGFSGWTPFIALRAQGNRLVVSSCLECDHAEILSWNPRSRRFVWRSEGR